MGQVTRKQDIDNEVAKLTAHLADMCNSIAKSNELLYDALKTSANIIEFTEMFSLDRYHMFEFGGFDLFEDIDEFSDFDPLDYRNESDTNKFIKKITRKIRSAVQTWAEQGYSFKEITRMCDLINKFGEKYEEFVELTVSLAEKGRDRASSIKKETESDVFGQYAWADNRPGLVGLERDTYDEQDALHGLKAWINDIQPLRPKVVATLRKILNDKKYADIINEPNQTTVYRGLVVTRAWLMKLLSESTHDPDVAGDIDVKFKLTNEQTCSSWTLDKNIAMKFAEGRSDSSTYLPHDDKYSVVVSANVTENPATFLSGPGGFYEIPKLTKFIKEQECIALDDVMCSHILWKRFTA